MYIVMLGFALTSALLLTGTAHSEVQMVLSATAEVPPAAIPKPVLRRPPVSTEKAAKPVSPLDFEQVYPLDIVRVPVAATGPSRGPQTAPVTIVEFADFQCPFCARLQPTLEQLIAKYGDKVRLVFRQFPLQFHTHAQKAAEASLCAWEHGKFWEMHDAMFENQQALYVDSLKAKAAALGLNADAFNSCLDSGKYADQVQRDLDDGAAAGVSGTPAIFINGRFLSGTVPLEQLSQIVDDELRRSGR